MNDNNIMQQQGFDADSVVPLPPLVGFSFTGLVDILVSQNHSLNNTVNKEPLDEMLFLLSDEHLLNTFRFCRQ
jgi:hypothetical protein